MIYMTALAPLSDLIAQQAELEHDMTMKGIEMFRERAAKSVEGGNEDQTLYGLTLLDHLLEKVTGYLRSSLFEREAGKAGRKGLALKHLSQFEDRLEAVAYIGLRLVLANLSSRDTNYAALTVRIGRAIEDEELHGAVREEDSKFYRQLKDEAKKQSSYHLKRKVVNMFINRREMGKEASWPSKVCAVVGATVVEAIINSTGLIEKHKVSTGPKVADTVVYVVPTQETQDFIRDRNNAAEVTRPFYEPMIVEPADWTTPYNGGYLTRRVQPVRLVKSRQKGYLQSLQDLDIDRIYNAVNAAQKTAWSVNPFILTALEMAWDKDHSIGGIPQKFDSPIPPKPFDIEENEEARKEWRKEAAIAHEENRENGSKRTAFITSLGTASRYQLFDKLYMPYQLDFRGRIYAVPRLNPQGPDWMKALLQFSEGKPIDQESSAWLAIQVANTGGFSKIDKAPLEDRVQWVYDNQEKIIECANNPFENRWWTEADSPYCFLAACREWAGWVAHGDGFISHLPIALDGSCSGIQHFSMSLADEVGGAAVNLVPSEKPADIYTEVMNKAVAQVRLDASTGGDDAEIAKAWLRSDLMNRSCFKRPVMTYGYGSSLFGFRDQIFTDTLRPAHKEYKKGNGAWHFDDNGFKASLYLAKITLKAVEETVIKAAEAMAWLKKCAAVVTASGNPVRWTTPDGLPVVQHYREMKRHKVDTLIFGSRVLVSVSEDKLDKLGRDIVSKRKQASGLSPNYVHSLDACHLRLAVYAAFLEGIRDVALVHDSFGTHAADTGRFFAILRESMVQMYSDAEVMLDFYNQLRGQLTPEEREDLPFPPARGNLDIAAVLDSDFAFA
jgi:DNA-directed RNA polymerase